MKTDQNHESGLSADLQQERRYYCRGCGRPLPPGVRSHFHRECLRLDKRVRANSDGTSRRDFTPG